LAVWTLHLSAPTHATVTPRHRVHIIGSRPHH
jgi:hypothetical protein